MSRFRRAGLAVALVAAGGLGGLTLPTQAFTPGSYTWVSGRVVFANDSTVTVGAHNRSDAPQTVTLRIRRGVVPNTVLFEAQPTLQPRRTANLEHTPCGQGLSCPNHLVLEVVAATDAVVPSGRIFRGTDPNHHIQHITAGDFELIGPGGAGTHGEVLALKSDVAGVKSDVAGVQAGLDDLRARVGNRTEAFCAEGSVRNDPQGVLQMYVTLFSDASQQARIDYVTNKGTHSKTVDLQAGVRYTDDANATLIGPGGPLDGQGDVDTSVRVVALGGEPVFLACPVYFNRAIGAAGQVAAGHVQDGSSN